MKRPYKILEESNVLSALDELREQYTPEHKSTVDECIAEIKRLHEADLGYAPLSVVDDMLFRLQMRKKDAEKTSKVSVFSVTDGEDKWLTLCPVCTKALLAEKLADQSDYISLGYAEIKLVAKTEQFDRLSLEAEVLECCDAPKREDGCICPRKPLSSPLGFFNELSHVLGLPGRNEWDLSWLTISPFDLLYQRGEQGFSLESMEDGKTRLSVPCSLLGSALLSGDEYDSYAEAVLILMMIREGHPVGHVWNITEDEPGKLASWLCERLSNVNVLDLPNLAERWPLPLNLKDNEVLLPLFNTLLYEKVN